MDPVRNPYSPGAGTRPPALVGRDDEIEAMDVALQRLRLGRDGRSQMLTGLRGVGKTVMLNEFEQLADARGYFHEHVEVGENGDLAPRLASAFRRGPSVDGRKTPDRRTGPPCARGPEGVHDPAARRAGTEHRRRRGLRSGRLRRPRDRPRRHSSSSSEK